MLDLRFHNAIFLTIRWKDEMAVKIEKFQKKTKLALFDLLNNARHNWRLGT